MSYVDQHLLPDEKVIFRTKINWTEYLKSSMIFFAGLFILAFSRGLGFLVILISFVSFGMTYLKINTSEFAVTNKRVLIKVGILKILSLETMLNMIEGIYIEQGIIDKITNGGSIIIKGIGGTRNPFPNIAQPYEFRNAVNTQIAALK